MGNERRDWLLPLGATIFVLLVIGLFEYRAKNEIRSANLALQLEIESRWLDLEKKVLDQLERQKAADDSGKSEDSIPAALDMIHQAVANALAGIQVIRTTEVPRNWEYLILDCRLDSKGTWRLVRPGGKLDETVKVTEEVRRLGKQGWELVNISHADSSEYWVFKKPL